MISSDDKKKEIQKSSELKVNCAKNIYIARTLNEKTYKIRFNTFKYFSYEEKLKESVHCQYYHFLLIHYNLHISNRTNIQILT